MEGGQHPFKLKLHYCCNYGVIGKYNDTKRFNQNTQDFKKAAKISFFPFLSN